MPMQSTRPILATAIIAMVALAACRDVSGPVDSQPRPTPGSAANLSTRADVDVTVLERAHPVGAGVVASATIGPHGGTLVLAGAGLTLVVPPGAVSRPTRFTARAVPGKLVAYEFEPHGTTFEVPLLLIQNLAVTNMKVGNVNASSLFGGYFRDASEVSDIAGRAIVHEKFTVHIDNAAHVVTLQVVHFSGYLVATGECSD